MADSSSGCPDFHRWRHARRELLSVGGLGALGAFGLNTAHGRESGGGLADGPVGGLPRRAKAVLMIYLFGGPGQLDTFDMKPEAPAEIRGQFKPIATAAPGLMICEHLPRVARVMDKLTVVRTMSHDRNVHGGAVVYALTGELNNDPGIPGVRGPEASLTDHPNLGSTFRKFGPPETGIPNAVVLPSKMIDGQGREPPGQWAGMLGKVYNPWLIDGDPNSKTFRLDVLTLPADVGFDRLDSRRRLLELVDRQCRALDASTDVSTMDALHNQAATLLTAPAVRKAFALADEPAALRDRYGRNRFGQACVLARRLLEAGAPYIQVNMGPSLVGDYGWDTHANTFPTMKKSLCPKFDAAFSSLMTDLDERGLLEDTLVLVNSEFGRSPKIQANGGRDHWPRCYSLLFAGAGVSRGRVIGKSDSRAAYPTTPPYSPADVAATVYAAMGIPPTTELRDTQNRPIALNKGRVMTELWG
ncbi:MAG: DUF1501 domain-containing protein [Planctomycetia bacterium]